MGILLSFPAPSEKIRGEVALFSYNQELMEASLSDLSKTAASLERVLIELFKRIMELPQSDQRSSLINERQRISALAFEIKEAIAFAEHHVRRGVQMAPPQLTAPRSNGTSKSSDD
jgi:hypothetical protein